LQAGKGFRISKCISHGRYCHVITAQFPFFADLAREPPDSGMVKEQDLNQGLDQVEEKISSSNVGKFMRKNGFNLLGTQS